MQVMGLSFQNYNPRILANLAMYSVVSSFSNIYLGFEFVILIVVESYLFKLYYMYECSPDLWIDSGLNKVRLVLIS